MRRRLRAPEWRLSPFVRILPFVAFLITIFQLSSDHYREGPIGVVLLATFAAASIAAWFVWSPKSNGSD